MLNEKTAKHSNKSQPAKSLQDCEPTEKRIKEIGGSKGPEPTRYGDWEKNGRCIDF